MILTPLMRSAQVLGIFTEIFHREIISVEPTRGEYLSINFIEYLDLDNFILL